MPVTATSLPRGVVTDGAAIAVCSEALGERLMPWQQQAADLIGAVDPARPDRWRFPLVVITVPRQSGKSTLLRALHLRRLLSPTPAGIPQRPTTIWMTAQTGKDARRRFSDLAERVAESAALGSIISRRRSIGSEELRLGRVGLSPFAPTPRSLHGETTPFVSIDEAWAFDEDGAAALLAAVTPTMQNVTGSQLVIVSTAGDARSRWLWSLVKAGRESLTDPTSSMAYVEYAAESRYADDGDGDPLDPAALDFHPAIAGGITTADAIRGLYPSAGSIANIRRGFLNLWPSDMDTGADARDLAAFDASSPSPDDAPPATTPAAFAFDVARDRSGAAIYAATPLGNGRTWVEHVESAPGVAWLDAVLPRLPGIAWHDPTGYTLAAAERSTAATNAVPFADLAAATAKFLADLADGSIILDAPPQLRDQFEHATTRNAAGAGFVFDLHKSPALDHLRAALLAHYYANRDGLPAITF